MTTTNLKKLTGCGGCTAKLPPGKLKEVLESIPQFYDPNLLVGFDSSDDGAVYKLTDDIAIIKTLDFFPPMTDDPYTFGKIAAANSLSDIYAMGGEVKIALNIVCFPEKDDMAVLGEILRGGAEKVLESGGVLCGGHSISDEKIKYGLSVTGVVHPDKVYKNNSCKIGDDIILTKPLGIGIITSAYSVFKERNEAYEAAVHSMETLNKYAAEVAKNFDVSACTDVTGFGFLGHLNEMSNTDFTISVDAQSVSYIPKAYDYAKEFIITAGGQKNRKFLTGKVGIQINDSALEEIMFDSQTSGGLLISLPNDQSNELLKRLKSAGVNASIVAKVVPREKTNIIVK